MKLIVQLLLFLSILAFLIGTVTAFIGKEFIISAAGYWRGSMGLLAFAIAVMLYLSTFCCKEEGKKTKK